jgi:hypothetical protein
LFFGEDRTFDGGPRPALPVSIHSETALWMIVTLRALSDVGRRRQQGAARRKRCAEEAVQCGTGADDGERDDHAVR